MPTLVESIRTAPSYWFLGILWTVLVDGDDTEGRQSVMYQKMPGQSGPPPHVHPFNDEWFQVLEGSMAMHVGEREVKAEAGTSVWIPRGTVHGFQVTSTECTVLNGFTPAGMEKVIKTLGTPAETRELPPKELQYDPKSVAAFANNYWGMEASVPFAFAKFGR